MRDGAAVDFGLEADEVAHLVRSPRMPGGRVAASSAGRDQRTRAILDNLDNTDPVSQLGQGRIICQKLGIRPQTARVDQLRKMCRPAAA